MRVRTESRNATRVLARNHSFRVGSALSFEPKDELPSALEHLLGSLASDLLTTFAMYAKRARIPIDASEVSLNCRLENPLMYLGVIGESGSPAIESIDGVFYVSADEDEPGALNAIWTQTLHASPIYATLAKSARLTIRFQPTG